MTTASTLLAFLLCGLVAGFSSQRSRLCFVSAVRDLFLFGATGMTRAVLVWLLATAGAGALAVLGTGPAGQVDGPGPAAAVAGGLLFGLGMTLAGSCAVGAFWRLGEGQLTQLWILAGIGAGTWLYQGLPVLSEPVQQAVISPWVSVALPLALLAALHLWERRLPAAGVEVEEAAAQRSWRAPWAPVAGAVVIAVTLGLFYGGTGRTWGVTRAFLLDDAAPALFVLGLVGGGFLAARVGREWRIRSAGTWPQRLIRLLGGMLMGYGAGVGWGCTVGAVLSGVLVSAAYPWFWLLGSLAGAWVGAVLLRRFMALYV